MTPNTKIIELRKNLSLSQYEFAEMVGISRSTVADIERGKIEISKRVKSKIVGKLGIEIGYFNTSETTENVQKNEGNELGSSKGTPIKELLFQIKNNANYDKSHIIVNQLLTDNGERLNRIRKVLKTYFQLNRAIFQFTNQYSVIFDSSFQSNVMEGLENGVSEEQIKEDFEQALTNIPALIPIYKRMNTELGNIIKRLEQFDNEEVMGVDVLSKAKIAMLQQEYEKVKVLQQMHSIPDYL